MFIAIVFIIAAVSILLAVFSAVKENKKITEKDVVKKEPQTSEVLYDATSSSSSSDS